MKLTQSPVSYALIAVIAVGLAHTSNANAVDAEAAQALAKKNNCFRCHGIDKDKDGPAWKKIAAKYKALPDAEAKLTTHLTTGPKPSSPTVTKKTTKFSRRTIRPKPRIWSIGFFPSDV